MIIACPIAGKKQEAYKVILATKDFAHFRNFKKEIFTEKSLLLIV